ncbi:CRAL-TRIO domain-containing protein [Kockovaella imperatae]|uniref:CRAL-TRIO domain-containing protein n=1 Tax=Kockovaella imperatae TaxID=4999 RepID=A0A1Y1UHT2_9TREE|nr:CRAL-TRIO domain-containing protein [Kockovaella imperatae]ORX37620.1 CRAL-TRIO domain-containing protein [Kockovaella imperatae]
MQAEPPSTSTKTWQYPSGQLGHLTESQQQALDKFKQLLAEKGTYTPSSEGKRPSHSDAILLRFLRARKFDPPAAVKQFSETEEWRKTLRVDEVFDSIDVDEYEETRRLYPQWVGRRDKRGFPVYVFEVGHLDPSEVSATDKSKSLKKFESGHGDSSAHMLRLISLYEHLVGFVSPWCTAEPTRPYAKTAAMTQSCNIIDVSDLGIRKAYSLRSHLQDSSALSTKHYPETLDKIFVIGAPSFFDTLWSWIKNWLDPVVASKVFILPSKDLFAKLSEHIDPENIPKKYGGQLDWKWGDLPNYDPALLKLVDPVQEELTLPIGPTRWEEGDDGEMVLVATGTKDGEPRREKVLKLKSKYDDVLFFKPSKDATQEQGSAAPTTAGPPVTKA